MAWNKIWMVQINSKVFLPVIFLKAVHIFQTTAGFYENIKLICWEIKVHITANKIFFLDIRHKNAFTPHAAALTNPVDLYFTKSDFLL